MSRVFIGLLSISPLLATPLSVEPLSGGRTWFLPGGLEGRVLAPDGVLTAEVKVPELSELEKRLPGGWYGVLSVDLHGTVDSGSGNVTLEALDPASGKIITSTKSTCSGEAPRLSWSGIVSSKQTKAGVENLFDGDPTTTWHSRYRGQRAKAPHWIGAEFGDPVEIRGVRYQPRAGGINGVVKGYRVEVRAPGGTEWNVVEEGQTERGNVVGRREALEVHFKKAMKVDAFRFVITTDWGGEHFGSAAELSPIGYKLPERSEHELKAQGAKHRMWLELPPDVMELLSGKRFALRLRGGGGAEVVLGAPIFCRVHEKPGRKLFGRSNGGLGPDKLGAGLLGFTALTEHQQSVLTVMDVREGTPAFEAGLKPGDRIVSVLGVPLPVNDIKAGWGWFENSHESVLGRASEAVLCAGEQIVKLGVLRAGHVEELELDLPRRRAFTTMNPNDDPEAAELRDEIIEWIVSHQSEAGNWSNDMKRTALAALALLSTGEESHQKCVKKAVDWALGKYTTPDKHGNLGFWSGAYMGILYAEWYLTTGDKRVLKPLEDLRDWAYNGQHQCTWKVPSLGHGPKGIPYGDKALVAPACHLLVYEALARRCGMEPKLWELLMPYMEMAWSNPAEGGHGAMGYNRSYKDLGEFWSRSGLFAMAAHLHGGRKDMRDSMVKIMHERHAWFRNSHAYGEPGGSLGLLALNLVDPKAYEDVMKQYAWWFSLAWSPGDGLHFTTPHMGAPYMGQNDLLNVAYGLVLQGPERSLHLTGKRPR